MERKEAIEIAKKLYNESLFLKKDNEAMVTLIPELKESEDEKAREQIIYAINQLHVCECTKSKLITYLEKQCEHANFLNKIQVGDKVTRNKDGILVNLSQLNRVAKKDENQCQTFTKKDVDDAYLKGVCDAKQELEKQDELSVCNTPSREIILAIWELGNEWKELTGGSISTKYDTQLKYIQKHWQESDYYLKIKQSEQKTFDYENANIEDKDFAPKTEPKFHVKDWIVTDKNDTTQIVAVNTGYYTLNNGMKFSTSYIDKYWHLWTIADAKDGDVLRIRNFTFIFQEITNNNVCHKDAAVAYCSYEDNDYGFGVCGPDCITDLEIITPATKEQRNTLFAKIKEAGYEWDAEHKQLKKVEQEELIEFERGYKKAIEDAWEYFSKALPSDCRDMVKQYFDKGMNEKLKKLSQG